MACFGNASMACFENVTDHPVTFWSNDPVCSNPSCFSPFTAGDLDTPVCPVMNPATCFFSQTFGFCMTSQAGFVSNAVDVFHQLGNVYGPPSPRVYVTLISRLLHVKRRGVPNLSLALQLWEELARSGVPLDAASYRAGERGGRERADTGFLHRHNYRNTPSMRDCVDRCCSPLVCVSQSVRISHT